MDSGSRGWRRLGRALASSMAGVVVVAAAAIAFGGPGEPAPMASINDPFRAVDFSAVPPMRVVRARDGAPLAFHAYPAAAGSAARGSVVLVHGSSAQGRSLHPLAQGFANAGYEVLALDIRGHGGSGTAGGGKGRIAYVGQLEDDLEDVMNAMAPPAPVVLAGFSSGGGFALRVAGGDERRRRFAGFLLLAPFLGPDAPTYRPNSGGWVSVGLPRYIALDLLDRAGLPWFQQLPVLRFALDAKAREFLTPEYAYALARNFGPHRDWRADIRAIDQPLQLLAGTDDEAFHAARYAEAFETAGRPVPVTLLPGIGHIGLTLAPAAIGAAVEAVGRIAPRP